MFEFPTEKTQFKKDGPTEPFTLSKYLTLSMSDQGKMKPFLESWTGKKLDTKFDVFSLIGSTAFISVSQDVATNGKTYANIGVIMPLPKGMECPAQVNESIIYTVTDHDDETYFRIYPKLQEKIASSDEMKIPEAKAAAPAKPTTGTTPAPADPNAPPF